jgi:DNA-binding NtrC family response regulator
VIYGVSGEKRTIIIVDDDKSILRVFTRVLERKGYAVTTAENGKDAIDKIRRTRFDAALIDVRLPDMHGTSILPIIQETSASTVKIMFTGSPDLDQHDKKNSIMDAFLIKPVKPEILLSILQEKLNAKQVT